MARDLYAEILARLEEMEKRMVGNLVKMDRVHQTFDYVNQKLDEMNYVDLVTSTTTSELPQDMPITSSPTLVVVDDVPVANPELPQVAPTKCSTTGPNQAARISAPEIASSTSPAASLTSFISGSALIKFGGRLRQAAQPLPWRPEGVRGDVAAKDAGQQVLPRPPGCPRPPHRQGRPLAVVRACRGRVCVSPREAVVPTPGAARVRAASEAHVVLVTAAGGRSSRLSSVNRVRQGCSVHIGRIHSHPGVTSGPSVHVHQRPCVVSGQRPPTPKLRAGAASVHVGLPHPRRPRPPAPGRVRAVSARAGSHTWQGQGRVCPREKGVSALGPDRPRRGRVRPRRGRVRLRPDRIRPRRGRFCPRQGRVRLRQEQVTGVEGAPSSSWVVVPSKYFHPSYIVGQKMFDEMPLQRVVLVRDNDNIFQSFWCVRGHRIGKAVQVPAGASVITPADTLVSRQQKWESPVQDLLWKFGFHVSVLAVVHEMQLIKVVRKSIQPKPPWSFTNMGCEASNDGRSSEDALAVLCVRHSEKVSIVRHSGVSILGKQACASLKLPGGYDTVWWCNEETILEMRLFKLTNVVSQAPKIMMLKLIEPVTIKLQHYRIHILKVNLVYAVTWEILHMLDSTNFLFRRVWFFSKGKMKVLNGEISELLLLLRHDKEKEMVSMLFSILYGTVISLTQIKLSFVLFLEAVEVLAVGILDVVEVLTEKVQLSVSHWHTDNSIKCCCPQDNLSFEELYGLVHGKIQKDVEGCQSSASRCGDRKVTIWVAQDFLHKINCLVVVAVPRFLLSRANSCIILELFSAMAITWNSLHGGMGASAIKSWEQELYLTLVTGSYVMGANAIWESSDFACVHLSQLLAVVQHHHGYARHQTYWLEFYLSSIDMAAILQLFGVVQGYLEKWILAFSAGLLVCLIIAAIRCSELLDLLINNLSVEDCKDSAQGQSMSNSSRSSKTDYTSALDEIETHGGKAYNTGSFSGMTHIEDRWFSSKVMGSRRRPAAA